MGGGSKNGKIIQQSKQYKEGNVKRENSQTVHDPSNWIMHSRAKLFLPIKLCNIFVQTCCR